MTKVLRRIASSASNSEETFTPGGRYPLGPLKEYSSKVKERGPRPCLFSLRSYSSSYAIKEALISRSGLRELRNSSVFIIDQRYFLMMYTARTEAARLCPRTE